MKKQHDIATRVIHAGQSPDPSTGAIMMPIYATSTYVQESPGRHKGYDYSRSINPTRCAYERCVADLESGTRGWAFASGLAAMSTILELIDSGSHVIASDDLYGGTYRLFERVRRRSANLDFTFVDMTDVKNVERAMKPNTRMVWIETPSNPLLKVIDLEAVAKIARAHNALSVSDNTFATPWIQRPIEFGFDIVVHSATKYLNGHSDMVGGVAVVGENKDLGDQMGFYTDPYSKFGQLTYEMWRATRLVVDTGMHAFKWDRQRAIDYMKANTAKTEHDITVEVDRYIVWPGQALAYKMGELKFKELKARAKRELGDRFDIRKFHDAVLLSGALPLDILESRIDAWIAKEKAAPKTN